MFNLYSNIEKFTHNIILNYSTAHVSDMCSRILDEITGTLGNELDMFCDGKALDNTIDIYGLLSDSESKTHKIIKHNCQILGLIAVLNGAQKVLLKEISPTMFYLSRFLGQDKVDYVNDLELYFLEKVWQLDTSMSRCVKKEEILNESTNYLYDIIFLDFKLEANSVEDIKKYYRMLADGGAIVISYSNPMSTLSSHSYRYYHEDFHDKISRLENVKIFHLTEACSYTIVTKGSPNV